MQESLFGTTARPSGTGKEPDFRILDQYASQRILCFLRRDRFHFGGFGGSTSGGCLSRLRIGGGR